MNRPPGSFRSDKIRLRFLLMKMNPSPFLKSKDILSFTIPKSIWKHFLLVGFVNSQYCMPLSRLNTARHSVNDSLEMLGSQGPLNAYGSIRSCPNFHGHGTLRRSVLPLLFRDMFPAIPTTEDGLPVIWRKHPSTQETMSSRAYIRLA